MIDPADVRTLRAAQGPVLRQDPSAWRGTIADEGGDPFIYSFCNGRILHAIHGTGIWAVERLYPSLRLHRNAGQRGGR